MSDLSASDVMAMTNDNGAFGNGGVWIFALLILLMLGGGGFGGSNQTTDTLNRAIDLNSIQQGQADISSDVQRTAYETMGSVKDASYNNLGEIRDVQAAVASGFANQQTCCCETKQAIMENRYLASQNTSAIQMAIAQSDANTTAQVQSILNKMNEDKIASLEQQIQTLNLQNAMAGVVKYPMMSAYSSGNNPYCTGIACSY